MEVRAFEISTVFADLSSAHVPDVAIPDTGMPHTRDPRGRLVLRPDRIVPVSRDGGRKRRAVALILAFLVHAGFATLFLGLADWRRLEPQLETAIPVEIVAAIPVPPPPPAPPPLPVPPDLKPPDPEPPSPPAAAKDEPASPPALLAPPPEAMPARTQRDPAKPAAPEQPPSPKPQPEASPPPEAPAVLSTTTGAFAVRRAARPTSTLSTGAGTKLEADPSAVLADALPMDLSSLPSTFRSILSGAGMQLGEEYKGLIYGRLQRSVRTSQEAQMRRLQGKVGVAFSVDAQGRAAGLKIAYASGNPALDALGLAKVRDAEPFPPPPQGVAQVFTPVFIFGQE